MTRNFLAITAMAMSLASTSALAQTAGTTGTTGTTGSVGADTTTGTGSASMAGADQGRIPMEWDGAIGDAFYSDAELGTLRDAEEMRANWDALSEDDKAVVRDYCEDFDTASVEGGAGADAQAGSQAGASAPADTATTGQGTGQAEEPGSAGTQSGVATTDAHQASIAQVCEMIAQDDDES